MTERDWSVDWEVDVEVTVNKTVTIGRSEIITAETAEQAIERAKEEMYVDESDLDLNNAFQPGDIEMDTPQMETFKLTTPVSEM